MQKIKVVAISGSLRKASFNSGLVRVAIELAPEHLEITQISFVGIPVYDKDIELKGLPDSVQKFKDALESADAILIATPEYNHSVPGGLKNAIDWASRKPQNSFKAKPVAIMGASDGGFGTVRSQLELRKILSSSLGSYVMPMPQLHVSKAPDKFDEESNLTDPKTKEELEKFLVAFLGWCQFFIK